MVVLCSYEAVELFAAITYFIEMLWTLLSTLALGIDFSSVEMILLIFSENIHSECDEPYFCILKKELFIILELKLPKSWSERIKVELSLDNFQSENAHILNHVSKYSLINWKHENIRATVTSPTQPHSL